MDTQRTVLIVDDAPEDRVMLRMRLNQAPDTAYRTLEAHRLDDALELWYQHRPDCVLLDYQVGSESGLDLLDRLARETQNTAPVVLLTGMYDAMIAVEAMKRGAQDFLFKDRMTALDLQRAVQNTIERVRMRHEHLRTEHLIQQINAVLPASLYMYDLVENRDTYINENGAAALGYTPERLMATGEHFMMLAVHPDDRIKVLNHYAQIMAEPEQLIPIFEYRLRHADGNWHWYQSRENVFTRAEDGSPIQIIGIANDVTNQKAVESALRESEEFSRTVLESSPDVIKVLDTEGHVLQINTPGRYLLETRTDPDIQQHWWNLWSGEGAELARESVQQALRGKVSRFYAFRPTAKGTPKWWDVSVAPIRIDNAIARLVVTLRDVTVQKNHELAREELLEREKQSRKHAETLADRLERIQLITAAFAATTTTQQVADVVFEHVLPALNAYAGVLSVMTVKGQLDILRTAGYPSEKMSAWARISCDMPVPMNEAVRTNSLVWVGSRDEAQRRFPLLATADPISEAWLAIPLNLEDRVLGALLCSVEPTQELAEIDYGFIPAVAQQCTQAMERARLYEEAQQARAIAEDAVRLRDQFLSIAAHELKNPLTILLGNAQLLKRRIGNGSTAPERLQQNVDLISDQAVRLNQMISTLLDVSRIGQGQLVLRRIPLDMSSLIRRIISELEPTLSTHSLSYVELSSPLLVEGDTVRLEQVLQNVLSNAVKYSPSGGEITVLVGQREDSLQITVSDQGIGIADEALPQLFQPFYRAQNGIDRNISGTGVGLYVVREILLGHGGDIAIASREGEGTTVTLTLPLVHERLLKLA